MNLYQKLANKGYAVKSLDLIKNPKDDRRFISLKEINLENVSIQFKSACNATGGLDPKLLEEQNAIVSSVVVNGEKYGQRNLIATDDIVMVHDTPLSAGTEESLNLATSVYELLGEDTLKTISHLTAEQISSLESLGFTTLVAIN